MDTDDILALCVALLIGIGIMACVLFIFGVFEQPQNVMCDDISLMSGYETRILDDACELRIEGYWITYDNYIEHLR